MVPPTSPNQNFRQIGPGVPELKLDIQTNKQTEITTVYIFIDTKVSTDEKI